MALVQIPPKTVLPQRRAVQRDTIPIRLPDLFVLFLSSTPVVNPHYETVRKESEAWFIRECSFGERAKKVLTKTDFSYFCAIATPEAAPEELRTVCDWGNWVFPFDDKFDNGGLKDDPEHAHALVNALLAGMVEDELVTYIDDPLVQVYYSVWQRVSKDSPSGVSRRFAKSMSDYCNGTLEQVRHCSTGARPSLDEMLALRRQSAGVSPLFALVEYAHKLELPDCVFESRSIQEIERIGIDLVLLQNDMLSYCKEEKEGVTHNMVAICRQSGMPAQMAFNHIGGMLVSRYRDWYLALAELPTWGERVDSDVQRYIRGVQNVVQANLNWSFRSGRYFGKVNESVRKTGIVTVRPQDADLGLFV